MVEDLRSGRYRCRYGFRYCVLGDDRVRYGGWQGRLNEIPVLRLVSVHRRIVLNRGGCFHVHGIVYH